jgi:hypothetical protein
LRIDGRVTSLHDVARLFLLRFYPTRSSFSFQQQLYEQKREGSGKAGVVGSIICVRLHRLLCGQGEGDRLSRCCCNLSLAIPLAVGSQSQWPAARGFSLQPSPRAASRVCSLKYRLQSCCGLKFWGKKRHCRGQEYLPCFFPPKALLWALGVGAVFSRARRCRPDGRGEELLARQPLLYLISSAPLPRLARCYKLHTPSGQTHLNYSYTCSDSTKSHQFVYHKLQLPVYKKLDAFALHTPSIPIYKRW